MSGILCPECGEPMSSDGSESTTLVGYYSPARHNHDDNCRKRLYVCSNGHRLAISKQNKCPACDWVGKTECFCCDGQKFQDWPTSKGEEDA